VSKPVIQHVTQTKIIGSLGELAIQDHIGQGTIQSDIAKKTDIGIEKHMIEGTTSPRVGALNLRGVENPEVANDHLVHALQRPQK
jgi:hypothetical protein